MNTITAPSPMVDIDGRAAIDDWDLDKGTLHINHGSFGSVPTAVLDYQDMLKRRMESSPVKWFIAAPDAIGEARRRTACHFGIDPNTMVFVPNASAGATVVLNNMRMNPGEEILVSDHGYGAVVMGAERKALNEGGVLTTVHIPIDATDDDIVTVFENAMSPRTRLVIVDEITSPTAMTFPVKRIAAAAHRHGAKILVDGAHAPGLIPGNPADIGADYWIGNLHKFICNPRGCAMLIVRPELAQTIHPLINSWGRNLPYPERFDWQGTLDQTSYLCAPYTIEYLDKAFSGWDNIRSYIQSLADYGQDLIADAFSEITGEDHHVALASPAPALRLVRLPHGLAPDHDTADLLRNRVSEAFDVEAAFTSFDGIGYLRLSAFVYNTADDYRRFAEECVPALYRWSQESAD